MTARHIDNIDGHTVGIVYMAFGPKALASVRRSINSLNRLGVSHPVTVVGDAGSVGTNFVKWTGASPFDVTKKRNFRFRAGRVKPHLYQCSPYEFTLYVDADTTFMQPITDGFRYLLDNDIVATEEHLSLAELYNAQLAGWEINIQERDTTVVEIGGDDAQKFVNSGVMFFRKSPAAERVFHDWGVEWLRFQEWDEQLALMRAIHANPDARVKRLPVKWNSPHMSEPGCVIYHAYGRGNVRANPI